MKVWNKECSSADSHKDNQQSDVEDIDDDSD